MENFEKRYKKELAGQLGNLVARCTGTAINAAGTAPGRLSNSVRPEDSKLHEMLAALPCTLLLLTGYIFLIYELTDKSNSHIRRSI